MARKSGLQRKVLALYRRALITARRRDAVEDQGFTAFVRSEFRYQADAVKRRDFQRIEYLIRKGEKQLKLLGNEHVEGVRVAHMEGDPENPPQGE